MCLLQVHNHQNQPSVTPTETSSPSLMPSDSPSSSTSPSIEPSDVPSMSNKPSLKPTQVPVVVTVLCAVDEYVSSNTCVDCLGGSTNEAGDDPSGDATTCSCAQDQFVLSNVCTDCGVGETNVADNPVPGPNTFCDRVETVGTSCTIFEGATGATGDPVLGSDTVLLQEPVTPAKTVSVAVALASLPMMLAWLHLALCAPD